MRKAQDKLDTLKQCSGYQVTQSLEEEDDDQLESIGNSGGAQVPNQVSEEEEVAVPLQAGPKRAHTVRQRPRFDKRIAICRSSLIAAD